MLRRRLLVTTFLIVVGTVCFAPAHSTGDPSRFGTAANAETFPFGASSRDRNSEFLCTYGYKVSFEHYYGSGSSFLDWVHYAVPIKGNGVSVSEIAVTDSPAVGSPSFTLGIHKNRNGRPGKRIATGRGRALGSCQLTTVVLPKTFLAAGETYWIVENAQNYSALPSGPRPNADHNPTFVSNAVYWGYKPNARHNALYQYCSSECGSASRSDWLPVSGPAPFARVE